MERRDEGGGGQSHGSAEPGLVEHLIADIAFHFHWPLAELLEMEVTELLLWQRLAVERWNRANRVE
ncbi:MAG: GpE family phage tail protein [Novosphingobium sp.]